jgi:hypothetical protein
MAIVVDYTPYEAVGELAKSAGQSIYQRERQQAADQKDMMQLQSRLQQQNAQFMANLQQEALQEQFQYQSAMLMQRKQIDMDLELADYARNKQKLMQVMNMINESDEFNPSEKAELSLQAMSKYAGVGQGISSGSFGGAGGDDTMQRYLQQGTFKQNLAQSLQAAVDSGQMEPSAAENFARSYGLTADFKSPQELQRRQSDQALKRLETAQEALDSRFVQDGKNLYTVENNKKANKVKEGSAAMNLHATLKRQVEEARKELTALQEKQAESGMRQVFSDELAQSPELQKAVEIYGADKTFEAWKAKQGQKKQKEDEGGFKMRQLFLPYQAYRAGKGLFRE